MKKKSALFVSLAMVLVAVLALTTASFAWFTSSLNPSVGEFEVDVTTSDALLVSAEANKNFKVTLPYTDLAAVNTNTLPATGTKLTPAAPAAANIVSNKLTSTDGTLGFRRAKDGAVWVNNPLTTDNSANYTAVKANGFLDTDTSDAGNMHFMKFDVYFRASLIISSSQKVTVSLNLKNDDTTTNTDSKVSSVTAKAPNNGTLVGHQNEIAKIVRVAFVMPDALTGATAWPVKVWEPDSGTVTGLTDIIDYDKTNGAKYTTDAQGFEASASNDMSLFEITDVTKVQKVTVYVWMEGNDAECDNIVSGAKFVTNLAFIGKIETIAP